MRVKTVEEKTLLKQFTKYSANPKIPPKSLIDQVECTIQSSPKFTCIKANSVIS